MPPRKDRDSAEQHADQVERVLAEADGTVDSPDEPATADIPPDRTRQFRHVGLSRMRLDWGPRDLPQMQRIATVADAALREAFPGVYWFLERELYPAVRVQEASA